MNDTNVNWADILKYILDGEKSYDLIRDKEKVLLTIGFTGAGKTTTLLYIAGKKMKAGPGGTVVLNEEADETDIGKIGQSHGKSETRYIAAQQIDRFLCVDAPGFKDTEGIEIEVANFVSVGEVIRLCKSLVPVIVVDYNSLKSMKGQAVRELFTHVAQLFQGKVAALSECLQLFITHNDTDSLTDVKDMLESMVDCDSAGNSKAFIAMARFFASEIEEDTSSVRFVRPLKDKTNKRLCDALKLRRALKNPASVYKFNLPEDIRSRLENSLREIQQSVSGWISTGNTKELVHYLQIFSQLKSRLSLVEDVYNQINQSIAQYLLTRQHEVKSRFQIITNGIGGYDKGDIANLNEFINLIGKLESIREYLPTNLDTSNSLEEWAYTQLARFTASMNDENDFAMLKSISEKISQICDQLILPQKAKYPLLAENNITSRLNSLKDAAQQINFNGLDGAGIKTTLDNLYNLISQLDSASKTVGNCVKEVNCEEILEQCISSTNIRVSKVAQSVGNQVAGITLPVSVQLLQDFAFLREIGKHSRLSEFFGINLENTYQDIKNDTIHHGRKLIQLIAEGTQSNNVERIGKFKGFFDQLSAIMSLDSEIRAELYPELSATMLAINQKVNDSLRSIEEELKKETPDYDVVRDFHQYLQNNRWMDEFTSNINKIDEKLKDVENTLKKSGERLKRKIDFCWNRNKFDQLEILLKSAESLRELSDISEELIENNTLQDIVLDGLKAAFEKIETDCIKNDYSFVQANRDSNLLNNYHPICSQLLLLENWEFAKDCLNRSIDAKVRSLVESIAIQSANAKEDFTRISDTLEKLTEIANYKYLPDSVKQGKQSALRRVENILADIETNYNTAEKMGQIALARNIAEQFTQSRCLSSYFPDLSERVPNIQRRLVNLSTDRVDNINLLLSSHQFAQAKLTLAQFPVETSSEYINITAQITTFFDGQITELRRIVATYSPADFDGNVNLSCFQQIADLIRNIHLGNVTFGSVVASLNLDAQLKSFSTQLNNKFQNTIDRHSQNINIKDADRVLQDIGTMTGFPVPGLDLSAANELLSQKLKSLGNNSSYQFPAEITFYSAFDIAEAYANLQKNKEFFGFHQKIQEFERNFGQLVETICNKAEKSPPTDGLAELEKVRNCLPRLPAELQNRGKYALDQSIQRISQRISSVKEDIFGALESHNINSVVNHLGKVPASDKALRTEIYSKINTHFSALVGQLDQSVDSQDVARIETLIERTSTYVDQFPNIINSPQSFSQTLDRLKKKMNSYLKLINEFTHSNSLVEGNYSDSIVDTIQRIIQLAEINKLQFQKDQIVATLEPIEVQLSKINELYTKGTMQFDFKSISEALKSTKQAQPLLKIFTSGGEIPGYLVQLSMALSHIVTYSQLLSKVKEFVNSLPSEAANKWENKEFDRVERLLSAVMGNNLNLLQVYIPDAPVVSRSVIDRIISVYSSVIVDAQNAWKSEQYEKFNEHLSIVRKIDSIEKLLGKNGTVEINQLVNEKIDTYLKDFSSQETVEQLSQRLVDLRNISMTIPETHKKVHSSIEKLLNMQSASAYSKLATQIDSLGPSGKLITEEFPHFSAHQRDLWVKKTQGQDIAYAIENFQITLTNDDHAQKSNSFVQMALSMFSSLTSLVKPKPKDETDDQKKERLQPYLDYYGTFQDQFRFMITKYQQSKDPVTKTRYFTPIINDTRQKMNNLAMYLPQILANICAVWSLKKSNVNLDSLEGSDEFWLQPHPVQFLTLLRLLDSVGKNNFNSQLVQVQTGEGKSVILGVLSTVFALLGYEVSCVCYSSYLSHRDFKDFEPVFKEFGIKHLIHYSTISQMCNRILNQDGNVREFTKNFIEGNPIAQQGAAVNRPNRILLIDEVDVFFGVDFYGNCFNPATLYANQHTFALAKFIWTNRKAIKLEQVLQHSAFLQLKTDFPDWEKLFVSEIMKMIHDVNRVEEFHPSVMNDLVGYKLHDEISTDIAYGYATAFAYFHFHERGDISDQSLMDHVGMYIGCGSFSYAEIPHMFKLIMGVSGTLDSLTDVEKTVIAKYNIKRVALAPSIYGASRRSFMKQKDVKVIGNKSDWLLAIQQSASDKIAAKQSVLIFFNDEEILKEFSAKYENSFKKYETLTERKEHKDTIVKLATNSGTVTACTRVFARGVDFICRDDTTRSNGGVHVIDTFLCGSEAEFCQLKGRSARQGDPGSFEILLFSEDLQFVEISQEKADTHSADGTLFDVLQTVKDNYYKAKVQSLIEKADVVKDLHNKTNSYLSLLKDFKGLPEQKKNIMAAIIDLNAAGMVSAKSTLIYHLYFCLDDSGSMKGSPWNDLIAAVQGFISKRIELCRGAGCEPTDLVTIVNYSSTATVSARNVPILDSPEKSVVFRSGGTSFKVGLDTVRLEIEKIQSGYTPILIFMSDGGSSDGEHEIQLLSRDFGANGLQIFVVGFGGGCVEDKLKKMATISGGQYFFGKNGVELKSSFESISSKLSTTTLTM